MVITYSGSRVFNPQEIHDSINLYSQKGYRVSILKFRIGMSISSVSELDIPEFSKLKVKEFRAFQAPAGTIVDDPMAAESLKVRKEKAGIEGLKEHLLSP